MYASSKGADYDQESTDEAIKEFEKYSMESGDEKLREEAKDTVKQLRERKAENLFKTGQFYEKQKKYLSAEIYYREVVDKYDNSSFLPEAKKRLAMVRPLLKKSQ